VLQKLPTAQSLNLAERHRRLQGCPGCARPRSAAAQATWSWSWLKPRPHGMACTASRHAVPCCRSYVSRPAVSAAATRAHDASASSSLASAIGEAARQAWLALINAAS
jgi:hypothetical protein